MSLVDSAPVFAARCRAVGLTAEAVTKLAEKGWNTYATFAFCVPSLPGSSEAAETLFVTRVIEPVLGDPDHADGPKLRRLAFESFTMNAADLKRRVESNEGDAPKKLPALEIAHRLDAIRDKQKPVAAPPKQVVKPQKRRGASKGKSGSKGSQRAVAWGAGETEQIAEGSLPETAGDSPSFHQPEKPASKGRRAHGKVQFMTSQEAEYPSLLCKHTVDCILQELRRRGRNFQASRLEQCSLVQVLRKRGVMKGAKRFLQDALQLTHPFDNPLIVSEQNRCTISSVSPADAAEWRLGQLRKYLRLAVELSSDEARLHEGLRPDLVPVLQGKRLLLFKAMMEDAGVADPYLFQHMVDGFPLVGHMEPSGQFPKRWKPARLTLESLKKTSHWARKAALSSCAKGAADQQIADAVWSETQDQLQRGWLKGPFTEADLDARNSGVWIPSRRFGVKQGVDKIRCVDDFSEFLLNEATATSEKLVLEGLDDIVALARFWLSVSESKGLVAVENKPDRISSIRRACEECQK
ncbi:unnamed protein product, partial [Effrenium voratum]